MAKVHLISVLPALLALLIGGCVTDADLSTRLPPGHYVLQSDTLYSVALQYGLDYRELATINEITAPVYTIVPGQILLVKRPPEADRPKAPKNSRPPIAQKTPTTNSDPSIDWIWPMEGTVQNAFGSGRPPNKGLDIKGSADTLVRASAEGEVVYAGSAVKGYGNLIILEHRGNYLSTYAGARPLAVKVGQRVHQGESLMQLSQQLTQEARKTWLHFEIRQKGQPVNPELYLPSKKLL